MNAMDPVVHHNPSQSTLAPVSSSRRRGSRENETPAQRLKREKAAERQRRKRERDRHVNNLTAAMSYPPSTESPLPTQPQPPPSTPQSNGGQELSPEEIARKERIRASARERQRKHRSSVKQRKMMAMNTDMPGMEPFRVNGEMSYPIMPPPMNPQDAPLPPPLTPGQTLASALFMAFSCACPETIKEELLRWLSLTTQDLPMVEQFIAAAFDQWDHERRRVHFQVAAQHQQAQEQHPQTLSKLADGVMAGPSDANDASESSMDDQQQRDPHNFRARFARSLVVPVPTPFRSFNAAESGTATTSPTSTPGSGPPSDPIDPNLTGAGRPDATVDDAEGGVVGS